MLICARDRRVPFARRGCIALAASPDLERWEHREPLWSGSVCWAAECPDMFHLDGRWVVVYSHGTTRYRVAESSTGPWRAAWPDTFDSHFLSAAKSLNDGQRQILFGWVPTLEGERDGGGRIWGGHMAAPRELVPLPDGSLAVRLPRELAARRTTTAESDQTHEDNDRELGDARFVAHHRSPCHKWRWAAGRGMYGLPASFWTPWYHTSRARSLPRCRNPGAGGIFCRGVLLLQLLQVRHQIADVLAC